MGLRQLRKTGISTKLILMNLGLLGVFAVMGLYNLYSFQRVEQLVSSTITADVGKNLANAAVLRELSGVFAQAGHLARGFIKNHQLLDRQGKELVGAVARMADSPPDSRLERPLREYSEKLDAVIKQCGLINAVIQEIEHHEQRLQKEHDALEQAISDARIAMIIKGHDPSIMEQLAILVTSHHESLLGINLRFFRLISEEPAKLELARRKELLAGIDELSLQVQTLTASEPKIAGYAHRLAALVKGYRESVVRLFTAMDNLQQGLRRMEDAQTRVIALMRQIDGEIAASSGNLGNHVTNILGSARRNLVISLLVLTPLYGLSIVAFIIFTIRRPMAAINRGITAIAAGKLDTTISLNRRDEWANIEQALNHMARELQRSYSELAGQHEHLEEMVRERTQALEDAQVELVKREKLAVLGQLTATVSHELRNPLGVIRSSVYYLQSRLPGGDEPSAKHLARIEQHVGLCDGIVADLLEYTRGRLSEKVSVDLNLWLAKLLADFKVPSGIRMERQLGDGIPILKFDPEKMRRVVQNLLENAIHAISSSARKDRDVEEYQPGISIVTFRRERWVVLEITDNGCGMAKEVADQAFEPLFTTRAQGTGLGLAIVRKIVDEHGGSVQIESTAGTGTRVTVQLPAEE